MNQFQRDYIWNALKLSPPNREAVYSQIVLIATIPLKVSPPLN